MVIEIYHQKKIIIIIIIIIIRIRIEGKGFWKRFLPVPGKTFKITSLLLWRLRLVCMWRLRSWATDEKSLDIYFSLSELKQECKF